MTQPANPKQVPYGQICEFELMTRGTRGDILDPLGVVFKGGYPAFDNSPNQLKAEKTAKETGQMFFRKWSTPSIECVVNPEREAEFKSRFTKVCSTAEEITKLFRDAIAGTHELGLFPYGPYGHVTKATAVKLEKEEGSPVLVSITAVYKKTKPTPTTASDLIYVIKGISKKTGQEQATLVAGIRKADPGKGGLAYFGGFRDIESESEGEISVYETGVNAALREGKEEGGIKLTFPNMDKGDYDFKEASGRAHLRGKGEYPCEIKCIGTIATGDAPVEKGGEGYPDGSKRVYTTSGYMVTVDVGEDFDEIIANADSIFRAGDDMDNIRLHSIDTDGEPVFGILHHKRLYDITRASVLATRVSKAAAAAY